jgi:hypothetical protein
MSPYNHLTTVHNRSIDPGHVDFVVLAVLEVCAGRAREGVKSDMVMHR